MLNVALPHSSCHQQRSSSTRPLRSPHVTIFRHSSDLSKPFVAYASLGITSNVRSVFPCLIPFPNVSCRSLVAPYGQSDIPSLHSVFDMDHFVKNAYFLDTQCQSAAHVCLSVYSRIPLLDRMPHVVGRFISKHVYDDMLRTQHDIQSPRCLRFVDVQGAEAKQGRSSVVRV